MTRLLRHILIASAATIACAVSAWAQTPARASETSAPKGTSPYPIAIIRALDKITARTTTIEAVVGQPVQFRTLEITANYCRKRPAEEEQETFVHLHIWDTPPTGERRQVFKGWMLGSGPALNPMEHSVYDVWVLDCRRKPSEPQTTN